MSEYTIKLGDIEHPFKWNMRAIKNAQNELGKSFDKATEEDQWGAYSVAIYYGCNEKFTRDHIEEHMDYETIGVITNIFNKELKKFLEAAGMETEEK